MTGQTQTFELNEDPHIGAVGGHDFLFKPEVYTDELLTAWAALRAVTLVKDQPGDSAEKIAARSTAVTAATKAFLAELMLDGDDLDAAVKRLADAGQEIPANPAGATAFLGTKLPDRVLIQLQRWILGVYGLRPTGPSNGSSTPSSTETPGDDSTGTSLSEE